MPWCWNQTYSGNQGIERLFAQKRAEGGRPVCVSA